MQCSHCESAPSFAREKPFVDLTADLAHEIFEYDPATGVLYRKPTARTGGLRVPQLRANDSRGYLRTSAKGGDYFVHRVIWLMVHGHWPINDIDHINRNPQDNRIENLRDVTRTVNLSNRRSRAKLPKPVRKGRRPSQGYVSLEGGSRKNPYRAQVRQDGKQKHLGLFPTSEAAWAAIAAHLSGTGSTLNDTLQGPAARAAQGYHLESRSSPAFHLARLAVAELACVASGVDGQRSSQQADRAARLLGLAQVSPQGGPIVSFPHA